MSIMKMTSTSNKNSQYFQKLYDYITDDAKSEGLVGTNGCSVVNAVPSMETLKKLLHKTGGRQTIEITLSLTPDTKGIDDNTYLRVADRVASFYPDYQSYYAVHKDSNLRHIHIVMNSVNFKTGRKFTQSKSELNRFRQLVNTVLKKFGFDIITESANNIWDDSQHSGTTFSYLELYEFMPDSRRFDLDIQPAADPLQMEDIFQEDSRNNITEKAVPWHYDGNGRECRNPDYPSDICDFSAFGFGRNYDQNSPIFNPDLLTNFHNPFEEAFKLPRSQRWNSQQSSSPYPNNSYSRRRPSAMYRKQPFMPVPPYQNQPMSGFQTNPYSTYSRCPPNTPSYYQGRFQGSQSGWETQDIYGKQPSMPLPSYPNYTAPTPLWQTPAQTPYPPDIPFSGNGYASQYQPDSPPQSMPSFMPQNPYPSVGVSIGNAYEINAAPGTEPGNIVQLVQGLLQNESEQRLTFGANASWAMQKAAFQQGIPVNCFADASPKIVINLVEPSTDNTDENIIEATSTDKD